VVQFKVCLAWKRLWLYQVRTANETAPTQTKRDAADPRSVVAPLVVVGKARDSDEDPVMAGAGVSDLTAWCWASGDDVVEPPRPSVGRAAAAVRIPASVVTTALA